MHDDHRSPLRDLPSGATLARARVPACLVEASGGALPERADDGLVLLDLALDAGLIASATAHHAAAPAGPDRVDLAGRIVWPCPVDMHTHLDKGHIWPRSRNPDGRFVSALETVGRDREANWSAADVAARMEFSLRCAYAHGTRAVRTHLDSLPPQPAITWPVFAEARERWAGRIELQGVALAMAEHYGGRAGDDLARLVADQGGVLGLVTEPSPDLDADLDRFLGLASDHGLDVDLHVDETLDPAADGLRHLAKAVLRNRFAGRAVAGHCCSLSVQATDDVRRTLDLVAEAGIAIVSLPMCNTYLQDREPGRTPRWRGVTLAHEIRQRGIPLAFASDNTRDPFYAYGDLDMHEVLREAVRVSHLDHPFGDWPASFAATPAAIMGLEHAGRVAPGAPADLVIFEGRSWTELLSRPESRRTVLRAGKVIDTTPPAYAELDHLFA
jgi:cytosine deaminase